MIVRGGTHQIYSTYHLTLGAIRFNMNRPQNFLRIRSKRECPSILKPLLKASISLQRLFES